jgi:aspartyl-tRNA synthetase
MIRHEGKTMKAEETFVIDSLEDWVKTHDCGALRASDIGSEALLMGWVNTRRDLGNLIFIDLRDREGITQVVFDPQLDKSSHQRARLLRNEWVIAVKGTVSPRAEGQENKKLPTGEVELKVSQLRILGKAETPPFQVDGPVDASETLRLKYRYLEMRRPMVFEGFRKRHLIAAAIRTFLNQKGFIEVETPFLTKSTPEGARDYLVPSRVNRGMFYALPQSPQLFKQLLMIGGFDRYYQIVRCFRDEDLRADRQPEFTQVDLEMSFVNEEGVMMVFEGLMAYVFETVLGQSVPLPIPRLEYQEAMDRFGSDRPDLRFGLELNDLSVEAARSEFRVFRDTVQSGGVVKAITVKGQAAQFSRKALEELSAVVTQAGARGLAWIKVTSKGWQSSLEKFFKEEDQKILDRKAGAGPDDLILIVADRLERTNQTLGLLRLEVAKRLGLMDGTRFSWVWITKFPLLEYNEEEKRLVAVHHPFTAPLETDLSLLEDRPERARARAYDLVLNGAEIGGGSVRIHDPALQAQMFRILGISDTEAQAKFGFLLEALRYGAPPHAGMALGFDRLVAIMLGLKSIRDVIAFPKTTSASCLMTDAPSPVDQAQLLELGLSTVEHANGGCPDERQ